MHKYLFIIIILVSLSISSNDELLDILYNEDGWELSDVLDDNSFIYFKDVDNIDLRAIKISKDLDINPQKVLDTIKDVKKYNDVLKNSPYLVTTPIIDDDKILAKHHISVPIFSDLYYFFRIFEEQNKVYWLLQDPKIYNNEKKSGYALSTGCGGWDYTENKDGTYKISYTLIFDIDTYPNWIVNYLNYYSLLNVYNDVIKAAKNKVS